MGKRKKKNTCKKTSQKKWKMEGTWILVSFLPDLAWPVTEREKESAAESQRAQHGDREVVRAPRGNRPGPRSTATQGNLRQGNLGALGIGNLKVWRDQEWAAASTGFAVGDYLRNELLPLGA